MRNVGLFQRIFGSLDWAPPPWLAPLAVRVDRGTAWAAAIAAVPLPAGWRCFPPRRS